MNTKTKTSIAIALALATGFAASAGADEQRSPVTCHGKTATFVGTEGDDHLSDGYFRHVNLGFNPVVVLAGGDDTLRLGAPTIPSYGSLTVCAGDGNDTVDIKSGVGGHSHPLIDGGFGTDVVGYSGRSTVRHGISSMRLIGGDGNDTLRGGTSDDMLTAGRGADIAYGVGGNDQISGGNGLDEIHGERGGDRMMGGQGADLLDGDLPGYSDGDDFANGGGGRDSCEAETTKSCES